MGSGTKVKRKLVLESTMIINFYRIPFSFIFKLNILQWFYEWTVKFSFWDSASCCACFIKVTRKNHPSQQLFKAFIVFYTSTTTCFGLHRPSSGGTHNIIYKEVTTDPLPVVQIVLCTLFDKWCHRLSKCDCEVSTRACNHFVFNIRCWKCGC
jgi:hypothetical protein